MKTQTSIARTICPKTMTRRSQTACIAWLPLLLLLTVPAVVQAQFSITTNNGAITITGYTGPGGAVTIPSMINGLPVTGIGDQAFVYCTSLTSVTIPNSITNIGNLAFYYCVSLTAITVDTNNPAYSSVAGVLFNKSQTTLIECPGGKAGSYTIPHGVASIGDWAFEYGYRLTNVVIPDSVTDIGSRAFYGCGGLTNVTVPISVTSIGDQAFSSCFNLTTITVDTNNPAYSSVAGVFFNKSQTTLIKCPDGKAGGYTIPNGVTSIVDYAFSDCHNLTSVTISNSVTSIGTAAFEDCTSLTNVTIGTSVTTILLQAFLSCTPRS